MADQLHLYVCELFKVDTLAALASGNFNDVTLSFFPARCGRPSSASKPWSAMQLFKEARGEDRMISGCSCIPASDKAFLSEENIKQIHLVNCFQMFAPKVFIDQLISDRAYLITPGWLSKWKVCVKQWGKKEQVIQMFSESVTKLVLLDTEVDPQCEDNLKELSEYLSCPSETIKVGLEHYSMYLENEILKWRLEQSKRTPEIKDVKKNTTDADYAMAFDLLTNLPRAEKEDVLAKKIMDLFLMLFAPQTISYLSIVDAKPANLWTFPTNLETSGIEKRLMKNNQVLSPHDSGKGFSLQIGTIDQILAVIEVDEIAFPDKIVKYQNLTMAMVGVFVLAIENSRYFEHIVKMNTSLKEHIVSKDQLFSIISHDLRSPFNALLGFSSLLVSNVRNYEIDKIESHVKQIAQVAKSTYNLLEDLLLWSKSQTGKLVFNPQRVVLCEVYMPIIETLQESADLKKIKISCFEMETTVLNVDMDMVKTIMRNLISNALKFTNENGQIDIYSEKGENKATITVSDNGVGIDQKTIAKLWDFSELHTTTGTANEKGTGFGLSLCKEFVEKHGGEIWAESEIGRGSKFKFTMPLSDIVL